MPYKTIKTSDGYTNTSPHGVKGRHMTKENAKSQIRLLQGIEHNPEFAAMIRRKGKSKGVKVAKPRF